MIDDSHLIWAKVLFCTTATWATVGQRVPNPYVPYRISRGGRHALLLVFAALSLAMAARGVGFHSLLEVETCFTAVWLGLVALTRFGQL